MPTPRAGLLALCLLLTFLAAPPLHSGVVAFPESSGEGAARRAEQAAPSISSPTGSIQANPEDPVAVPRFAPEAAGNQEFAHPSNDSTMIAQGRETRPQPTYRNLSLQPEAFLMGRRLGKRFSPAQPEKSILVGTLTINSELRTLQTTRTQTDDGEEVEIALGGTPGLLTWNARNGSRSSSVEATRDARELVERVVLDSPDQFVLAQLRGASYATVSRNVRPTDAGDNYAGPLWNIVRIGEPERDEQKKPQSAWRLYYINTRTGLIDRIVSELRGETIEAEVSGWVTVNGENAPTQITWTRQGKTIMEYRLTSFSRGQNIS